MSIQVKPGYTNPLLAMEQNKANSSFHQMTAKKSDTGSHNVTNLQNKQLQLQSEMLLMKSTGSGNGQDSAEKLKMMQSKLTEVSKALQTARADANANTSKEPPFLAPHSGQRTWRA